jgi:hypothetical protein
MAIEKNKGNIVDLVYSLVMDNIRKDPDTYIGLLSIITTSLSRLQECYPEVVKSYMSHTSLILDQHCVEIIASESRPFYGFTRDQVCTFLIYVSFNYKEMNFFINFFFFR